MDSTLRWMTGRPEIFRSAVPGDARLSAHPRHLHGRSSCTQILVGPHWRIAPRGGSDLRHPRFTMMRPPKPGHDRPTVLDNHARQGSKTTGTHVTRL